MSSGPSLLILYGSQTGTALELARRILRECRRVAPHLRVLLRAADDFDVRQMVDERLLCFVCSTTGRGEEPENMKKVPSIFIYFNLFEIVTVFARSSGSSFCARTYPQPHCPLSVSECSDWGTRLTQSSTLLPKRCTGEKSYCLKKTVLGHLCMHSNRLQAIASAGRNGSAACRTGRRPARPGAGRRRRPVAQKLLGKSSGKVTRLLSCYLHAEFLISYCGFFFAGNSPPSRRRHSNPHGRAAGANVQGEVLRGGIERGLADGGGTGFRFLRPREALLCQGDEDREDDVGRPLPGHQAG